MLHKLWEWIYGVSVMCFAMSLWFILALGTVGVLTKLIEVAFGG